MTFTRAFDVVLQGSGRRQRPHAYQSPPSKRGSFDRPGPKRPLLRLCAVLLFIFLASCSKHERYVVLLFPHGGQDGAAGLQADAGARLALEGGSLVARFIDLDAGVQNPHEDEGTGDERAVRRIRMLLPGIARDPAIAAAIAGPTPDIVRAAHRVATDFPILDAVPGEQSAADIPASFRSAFKARYREPASVEAWSAYQAALAVGLVRAR